MYNTNSFYFWMWALMSFVPPVCQGTLRLSHLFTLAVQGVEPCHLLRWYAPFYQVHHQNNPDQMQGVWVSPVNAVVSALEKYDSPTWGRPGGPVISVTPHQNLEPTFNLLFQMHLFLRILRTPPHPTPTFYWTFMKPLGLLLTLMDNAPAVLSSHTRPVTLQQGEWSF